MQNLMHKELEMYDQAQQEKLCLSEASATMNLGYIEGNKLPPYTLRLSNLLGRIGPNKDLAELLRMIAAQVDPIE